MQKSEIEIKEPVQDYTNPALNWLGCIPGRHPQQEEHTTDDFTIDSKFDNGNIINIKKVDEFSYEMEVAPDCYKTNTEKKRNKTWFYFRISKIKNSGVYTFKIKNMKNQKKIFDQGQIPVFRSIPSNPKWKYVAEQKPVVQTNETDPNVKPLECTLQFIHSVDKTEEEMFIAFTFPWSYEEDLKQLDELEAKVKGNDEIYFVRELAQVTRESRRVDILTITSKKHMLEEREVSYKDHFPEQKPRPHKFAHKKYVVISSRAHPGEVQAAHKMNGVLRFLCNKEDVRAKAARDEFVFLLIPNQNPDGTYRGHTRTDMDGENLNRFYVYPNPAHPLKQPGIYIAQALLLDFSDSNRLFAFIDFHGHNVKKGCFFFGNAMSFHKEIESRLLAKVLSLNSRYFDYEASDWTVENRFEKADGSEKRGAGRIEIGERTKNPRVYTLESNYVNGVKFNELTEPVPSTTEEKKTDIKDTEWGAIMQNRVAPYERYTMEGYEEIGAAIPVALLDVIEKNPLSRVKSSVYGNIQNVKRHIAVRIVKEEPFKSDPNLVNLSQSLEGHVDELITYQDEKFVEEYVDKTRKQFSLDAQQKKAGDSAKPKAKKSKDGAEKKAEKKEGEQNQEANDEL
jgi:hypothetical protein